MTKKKGPKMEHPYPAQDALAEEFQSLIDTAAETADENELLEREREADELIEKVRARPSRRERA
jgi:hypothetical protein